MQLKSYFMISFFLFTLKGFGQEIKTKVTEEGFAVQPVLSKEVQFEEARLFVYLGGGYGLRTGTIVTGFLTSDNKPEPTYTRSTDSDKPFRNGFVVDFGARYFFPSNIGLGLKTSTFINTSDFIEGPNNASQNTYIAYGMLEGLYRIYFSESLKQGFVYGGLGVGLGYISQTQEYRYSRVTDVSETFFAVRPMVGINVPIWDVVHGYGEAGYGFSQGKISDGTLSLSQFQITLGVHIRLNAF